MIELIRDYIRKLLADSRRSKEAALRIERYKSPMIGTDIDYRNRIRE